MTTCTVTGDVRMPYQPAAESMHDLSQLAAIYTSSLNDSEFRVLELGEYDGHGVLQCSLVTDAVRDPHPPYFAISYTWNEKERIWYGAYDTSPKVMVINGMRILISDKVANILSLMCQREHRRVWIDAICINQEDERDKSTQVRHMGSIYSGATTVVTFLCSPSAQTDAGLTPERWFEDGWSTAKRYEAHAGLQTVMMDNSYWSRTWVLQEIALGRKSVIICGMRTVDLGLLSDLCGRLQATKKDVKEMARLMSHSVYTLGVSRFVDNMKSYANQLSDSGVPLRVYEPEDVQGLRGLPFLEILHRTRRYRDCTNPSDILYSKLALAKDASALVGSPDYSLPVAELYRSFAERCIRTTGSLEVMTFAQHTTMDIPSWVPDWSSAEERWSDETASGNSSDMIDMKVHRESMLAVPWDATTPDPVIDGDTLIAYGRALTHIPEDFVHHRKLKQSLFDHTFLSREYHEDETPEPGDLICVLKGCPLFVYLHPEGDHFKIVGRNSRWHIRHFRGILSQYLWHYKTVHENSDARYGVQEEQYRWRFSNRGLETLAALEGRSFRIC